MLEVKDLTLTLPNGQALVDGLSFQARPGEVLALLGPSGSGKSTLLDWMIGALAPGITATGALWLNDHRVDGLATENRRMGLMMQDPVLFPHMTVEQNLLFGSRVSLSHEALKQALGRFELSEFICADPATLSGGQKARVSLLRTLLNQPQALLLDEPFARLDAQLREQVRALVWAETQALPVILVTHDEADIPPGAHRIQLEV